VYDCKDGNQGGAHEGTRMCMVRVDGNRSIRVAGDDIMNRDSIYS